MVATSGCATSNYSGNTLSKRLPSLTYGLGAEKVHRTLHAKTELMFSFLENGKRYECRRVLAVDTGWHYYLLWEDGALHGIVSSKDFPKLEKTSAIPSAAATIPHESGFSALKAPFADRPVAISDLDFTERNPPFDKMRDVYGELGETVMWAPVMVVIAPLIVWNAIHRQHAYVKIYALDLGDSRSKLLKAFGNPSSEIGVPGDYEVLIFEYVTVPQANFTHLFSVGLRNGSVVWIRHYYDASTDTWPRDGKTAETVKE